MPNPLQQRSTVAMGLEIWAIGTWDEVDLVRRMLDVNGAHLQAAQEPLPLPGADKGRYRGYYRVAVKL